jgi:hypothetical protein
MAYSARNKHPYIKPQRNVNNHIPLHLHFDHFTNASTPSKTKPSIKLYSHNKQNTIHKKGLNIVNSITTTQSDVLCYIRNEIKIILYDIKCKFNQLGMKCSQLDVDIESEYSKLQDEYIDEIDKVYCDRLIQLRHIDEKYNYDIYKNKSKDETTYMKLVNAKEDEIEEVEEDFLIKKNHIMTLYKDKAESIKERYMLMLKREEFLNERKLIIEMKERIYKVLESEMKLNKNGKVVISNDKSSNKCFNIK